eukprot:2975115-Rhodomonas_salina.1
MLYTEIGWEGLLQHLLQHAVEGAAEVLPIQSFARSLARSRSPFLRLPPSRFPASLSFPLSRFCPVPPPPPLGSRLPRSLALAALLCPPRPAHSQRGATSLSCDRAVLTPAMRLDSVRTSRSRPPTCTTTLCPRSPPRPACTRPTTTCARPPPSCCLRCSPPLSLFLCPSFFPLLQPA